MSERALFDVLTTYRNMAADIVRWRDQQFPPGTKLVVDCEQYKGPGVATRTEGTRPDQLAVRLENGNTWFYPLEKCRLMFDGKEAPHD